MNSSVTVMGIDPGSQCLGWGVVQELSGVLTLVDCGAIRPKGEDFTARIADLFVQLNYVVAKHAPHEAAIESVFQYKNPLSALKLGQARGVAVAACAANAVPVSDYEPTVIKKSLVGIGNAEKSQVAFMVGRLLNQKVDWGLDTSDALACAICHLNTRRITALTKRKR